MKKMYKQASLGELWHLSYPLIVTMAAQVIMQFADRMFLSWHSHEALAACVPAGVLAMTFASMFMGLASYTSVFISQYYAKKKYASVTISLWQGILLAVLSSVLLAALTPLGIGLINSFGHDMSVYKEIFRTIFGGYEAVTFLVVKPFNFSFRHFTCYFLL